MIKTLRNGFVMVLFASFLFEPGTDERTAAGQPATDPLPSWKDGPSKKAILEYVKAVTTRESPDFVPPEDRIATFAYAEKDRASLNAADKHGWQINYG